LLDYVPNFQKKIVIFFEKGLNFFEVETKVTQTVGSKTGSKTTPNFFLKNQNQNQVPILGEKNRKKIKKLKN